MQITGRISWVGDIQSGTSKSGNQWQRRPFEVTYEEGQYPRAVVFDCFDTNIVNRLAVGLQVDVKFDISTREYNGKKYNDIRIWKDGLHAIGGASQQAPYPTLQPAPAPQPAPASNTQGGDLPF